jgi:hypothetical protein
MAELEPVSKNLQYLLFLIKELGEVNGKVKLFKLHYLVEKEAHVLLDKPIKTDALGPVDYSSFNYCIKMGLIDESEELGVWGPKYSYKLTPKGKQFFSDRCEPKMERKEVEKAVKIIRKYSKESGPSLLRYVHEKYVDKFKDDKFFGYFVDELSGQLSIIRDLVSKVEVKETDQYDQEKLCDSFFQLKKIALSVRKSTDATERGTVITSLQEIFENIIYNGYKNDPYTKELIDFLDNYCDKQGIQKSMYSDDLSDLTKEERLRAFKVINESKIFS